MAEKEKDYYNILPEDFSKYDLSYKIIVIGDEGVGKTCLSRRATKNDFENFYTPTIGFEFLSFNVKIKDKNIHLQIWDTSGQEVYRSLVNGFYRNSALAILIYSIDNENSFNNLESWINEIKEKSHPNVKIFLIGNKNDLENNRKINLNEGKKFSEEHGLNMFFEASAKTGFNAHKIFIEAANTLYEETLKYRERANRNNSNLDQNGFSPDIPGLLVLDEENYKKKKKCCS